MSNLLMIDTRESLKGYSHKVINTDTKTITLEVWIPGVIVDKFALEEFRTSPFSFCRKYDLEAVQNFTLRKV